QGPCCLQFALLQANEAQQPEWIGTKENTVQFPEEHLALFGQVLGQRLTLLRHKEQTGLKIVDPAETLLIAQRLVKQKALFQQRTGLFVLSLRGGGAGPFSIAMALPPAVAQILEAGSSLLQPCMGQHKLTPGEGDSAQSI